MILTRREKIVLAIAALIFIVSMLVEQRTLDRFEWPFVLLFIPAMAWLLFTDPHKKREE